MKKIYILILCSIMAASLHAQEGFGTYLRDIIQKQEKGILCMARAIEACGLCDSLDILMDYEYHTRYMTGMIPTSIMDYSMGYPAYAPEYRRYGYTLFAETDDFWLSQGIDPNDPEMLKKLRMDSRQPPIQRQRPVHYRRQLRERVQPAQPMGHVSPAAAQTDSRQTCQPRQ